MAKIAPLMILPPVIFAGFAAMAFVGMFRDDPDALPSAMVGRAAPAVTITELGDTPVFTNDTLATGGVKLVNYWASWCGPCRVEHPTLEQLAAEGVEIFGINYKDDPGNALGFLAELGNPYKGLGADETGRTALDWGVYGVPETYVIDGQGNVVLRFAGPVTQRVLNERIRPAMEQAAQQVTR